MIGVFDSGIGGLTILNKLRKALPNEDFYYYRDKLNNPYGEKNKKEILNICINIVNYLISKNCKIIVIACNTATTNCIDKLRKLFPNIIFIGTVPAIKLATNQNFKNILLMATPQTIESEKTKELINDNVKDNQNIYLFECYGLANAIENNDKKKINEILDSIYNNYKDKNIDSIVLGCTHYPIISDNIKSLFPNSILLDGSDGVAKEVKKQLEIHNMLNSNGTNKVIFYNSETKEESYDIKCK